MKPLLILLVAACVSACESDKTEVAKSESPVYKLDSAIYYFTQLSDYKMKRDSNEIAYLRTGDEKYFRRGNECVGIGHEYYLKLKRVTDKK